MDAKRYDGRASDRLVIEEGRILGDGRTFLTRWTVDNLGASCNAVRRLTSSIFMSFSSLSWSSCGMETCNV